MVFLFVMQKDSIVTLANKEDARSLLSDPGSSFRAWPPWCELRMTGTGALRRTTRLERARDAVAKLFWWRHPRYVVVAVDPYTGTVTTREQRWSWTRWRWL